MGPLVVGGDGVVRHPPPHRMSQGGGGLRLEKAVVHVHHVVAPGPEEAHLGPLCHGELDLVPVPVRVLGPVDPRHLPLPAADALESVLDLLPLKGQLLGIGHVPQLAPPALGVPGAVGHLAARGGLQHLVHLSPGSGFAHL